MSARRMALLLALLCAAAAPCRAEPAPPDPSAHRSVLLILPENAAFPAVALAIQGLLQSLRAGYPGPVSYEFETLDSSWSRPSANPALLRSWYAAKYTGRKIDLIIAMRSDALAFVLSLRDTILPGVPVVFWYERTPPETLHPPPGVTGVWSEYAFADTLAAARRALPGARRLVIVGGDTSPFERFFRDGTRHALEHGAWPGEVVDLTGQPLDRAAARLGELTAAPGRSVIFLNPTLTDGTGRALLGVEGLSILHRAARAPIFTVHDTGIGAGATGGFVLEYKRLGQEVGQAAARVLGGEHPALRRIDVSRPVFDGRELGRWRIPDERLPPGSEIRLREPPLSSRYRYPVLGASALVLVLLLFIVGLLVERRRRARAEARNRAMLASIAGYVAVLDTFGRVVDANRALAQREGAGVPPAPLDRLTRGARYRDAFLAVPADDGGPEPIGIAGVVALVDDVLAGRRDEGMVECRGPGLEARWFEVRANALGHPRGGVVVSHVDVSERKRAELEARRALRELSHTQRVGAMGALAASIAHEINQPLTAIIANARAGARLLEGAAPDVAEVREALAEISADGQRAGEVIRRMRAMLKDSAPQTVDMDLADVAREVVRLASNDVLLRDAALDLDLAPDLPRIRGDAVQLQQVLLNLVINALNAVAALSPERRRVVVRTGAAESGRVELSVRDLGPGIPPENQARLFEPFVTTKKEGLGIGLYICRLIVEAHGGRLEVESRPGAGARFRCVLPVAG